MRANNTYAFTVVIDYRADEKELGQFLITVPHLPGCVARASSAKSALSGIEAAIEARLRELLEAGETVPQERELPIAMRIVTISLPGL